MICLESRIAADFPQAGHLANHGICRECIAKHIEVKVTQRITAVVCRDIDCQSFLSHQEIVEHLDAQTFARCVFIVYDADPQSYDELLARKMIESEPNFTWCVNPIPCKDGQLCRERRYLSSFSVLRS